MDRGRCPYSTLGLKAKKTKFQKTEVPVAMRMRQYPPGYEAEYVECAVLTAMRYDVANKKNCADNVVTPVLECAD